LRGNSPRASIEPAARRRSVTTTRTATPSRWSCLALRCAIVWVLCVFSPFPLTVLPGFGAAAASVERFEDWVFAPLREQIARSVLDYAGPMDPPKNGSGDSTVNWADAILLPIVVALIGALWNTLARGRGDPERLHAGLRVYLRYALATTMLNYAFVKILVRQMPAPSLGVLEEPLGDLSPMSLLWSFMGASPTYQRFTGLLELLGATLLLSRRTTLLGALIQAAVLVNVVMLNLCYDVPVKFASTTLLLLTLLLIAPDARRLWRFLVLRRSVEEPPPDWAPSTPRGRAALLGLELVGGAWLLGSSLFKVVGPAPPPSSFALEGRWVVLRQVEGGQELAADAPERWSTLIVNPSRRVLVRRVGHSSLRWTATLDADQKQLTLKPRDDEPKLRLTVEREDQDHLSLADPEGGRELSLHRLPPRSYPLLTRGFHWINEEPYAR
jgi:hypothetical protein